MTAPNVTHQSGHARAFIEHTPFNLTNRLFVMHEGYIVTFEKNGMLTVSALDENLVANDGQALLVWGDQLEDTIIDIFKAIAKALELYSDEPGQAYKQGFAEGQTSVYREWNASLRE